MHISAGQRTRTSGLVVEVRDSATGCVLAQLVLPGDRGPALLPRMRLASTTPGERHDASLESHSSAPVAGRIEAEISPLEQLLEGWLEHLRTRGKSAKTVSAYGQVARKAIRDNGWTRVEDVTYSSVLDWMSSQRASGAWSKGSTYNRNLTLMRSFAKHLARVSGTVSVLEHAENAVDDGDQGARAATDDEARAMIRVAWARTESDARSKGARDVWRAAEFLAGLRAEEPGLWRWKHVLLDEEIPVIRWTKDINKNRRLQEIAIAPELVTLLRRHRSEMSRLAAATGGVHRPIQRRGRQPKPRPFDPANPEAFVFPVLVSKGTWAEDAQRAGIPLEDSRQRPFSGHSARKWLENALIRAGVHTRIIDFLMRHRGDTRARYVDVTAAEQRQALALLPQVWPVALPGCGQPVENPESENVDLTAGWDLSEYQVPHRCERPSPTTQPSSRATRFEPSIGVVTVMAPEWLGSSLVLSSSVDSPSEQSGIGPHACTGFESPIFDKLLSDVMPRGGLENGDSKGQLEALARLMESIAGLLRTGAAHAQHRSA